MALLLLTKTIINLKQKQNKTNMKNKDKIWKIKNTTITKAKI